MSQENRRQTRSDRYQYLILESLCSHEMLESFSNDESLYNKLNPFSYNEELLDLEDKLKGQFWKIVNQLTPRQKQVIELIAKDKLTQMETAKKLNVNQSSITKSLNGNVDYKNGKKCYGGAKRRIIKLAEEDSEIQEILARMREIIENQW